MDQEKRPKAATAAIFSAWFAGGTFLLGLIGWQSWREDFMLNLRQSVAEWVAPAPVVDEAGGGGSPGTGQPGGSPGTGAEGGSPAGEDRKDNLTRLAEHQCKSGPFIAIYQNKRMDLCGFVTPGVAAVNPGRGTVGVNPGPGTVGYGAGTTGETTGGTGAGTSGDTSVGSGAGSKAHGSN